MAGTPSSSAFESLIPNFSTADNKTQHSNTLSDKYQDEIASKGFGPKEWLIDAKDWAEVFGYRFSVHKPPPGGPDQTTFEFGSLDGGGAPSGGKGGSKGGSFGLNLGGGPSLASVGNDLATLFGFDLNSGTATDIANFTLPIPPQTYVINPIFASQVTPTFGGVVEEDSPPTFWNIAMSGTFGTAISANVDQMQKRERMAKRFRSVTKTTGLLNGLSQELQSTIGSLASTANAVESAGEAVVQGVADGGLFGTTDAIAGATGAVTGAINESLLPQQPFVSSAVSAADFLGTAGNLVDLFTGGDFEVARYSNGFTEINELHKFFVMYYYLKANNPDGLSLRYTDFKRDLSWRCTISNFKIQHSAQNPLLVRYVIELKCWDIKSSQEVFIGTQGRDFQSLDRFGPNGDLAAVNTAIDPSATSALNQAFTFPPEL
jgi:hypothetical protein